MSVIDLDSSHHSYIREQLALHAEGHRLLGRFLGMLDLEHGKMWAIVPAERAAMAVADLEADVIRSDDERKAVAAAIARRLRPLLAANPARMLAIEYWMEVDVLEPTSEHAFAVGDSLFDYVTASDSDEEVERLLVRALWYPTVGVIVPVPAGVDLEGTKELTVAQIEEALLELDSVLVGAWTADGYVVWEPERDRGRS